MRNTASRLLVAGLIFAAAGCARTPDPEKLREELMAADRAFATATAERGVEGWVAYFAEDGGMVQAGEWIRGHEAIRAAMTPLFENTADRLAWDPVEAEASGDGTLGYTAGHYRLLRTPGDSVLSGGRYVTVWRRTTDGWRVVVDIGSAAAIATDP